MEPEIPEQADRYPGPAERAEMERRRWAKMASARLVFGGAIAFLAWFVDTKIDQLTAASVQTDHRKQQTEILLEALRSTEDLHSQIGTLCLALKDRKGTSAGPEDPALLQMKEAAGRQAFASNARVNIASVFLPPGLIKPLATLVNGALERAEACWKNDAARERDLKYQFCSARVTLKVGVQDLYDGGKTSEVDLNANIRTSCP